MQQRHSGASSAGGNSARSSGTVSERRRTDSGSHQSAAQSQAQAASLRLESLLQSLNELTDAPPAASSPTEAGRRRGRESPSAASSPLLPLSTRSRSVGAHLSARAIAYDAPANMSLAVLQDRAAISAFLLKLSTANNGAPQNSADAQASKWKLRFFVLSRDANLYIFKATAGSSSLPVTYLPLTGCSGGSYDPQDSAWLLDVYGDGLSAAAGGDGGADQNESHAVVTRRWTLKFPDEPTLATWVDAVRLLVAAKARGDLASVVAGAALPASPSSYAGSRSGSVDYTAVALRRGSESVPSLVSGSTPSARTSSRSNDAAARAHQEMRAQYIDQQREAAAQFRQRELENSLRAMEMERLALHQQQQHILQQQQQQQMMMQQQQQQPQSSWFPDDKASRKKSVDSGKKSLDSGKKSSASTEQDTKDKAEQIRMAMFL